MLNGFVESFDIEVNPRTGRRCSTVTAMYMYGNHSRKSVKLLIQQVIAVPPAVLAVVQDAVVAIGTVNPEAVNAVTTNAVASTNAVTTSVVATNAVATTNAVLMTNTVSTTNAVVTDVAVEVLPAVVQRLENPEVENDFATMNLHDDGHDFTNIDHEEERIAPRELFQEIQRPRIGVVNPPICTRNNKSWYENDRLLR